MAHVTSGFATCGAPVGPSLCPPPTHQPTHTRAHTRAYTHRCLWARARTYTHTMSVAAEEESSQLPWSHAHLRPRNVTCWVLCPLQLLLQGVGAEDWC